ncbi:MAG: ribosome recycling factor [Acidobacteriota bacterium]|nr:ribosome recycling factor [Acidobacteriota bacterium]MDH3785393.1 ribosome recycling factor [Acidobacteriota bacterium]
MTPEELLVDTDSRMDATLEDARSKLGAIRTGRASLSLFDGLSVEYYGTPTPLNQVAKLSIPEPSMIVAQPFDPTLIPLIEKAILTSDLGLNPTNDGKMMRIPIPPLTEERRKQLVKKVRSMGEDAKQAIRQIRRDGNEEIKKMEKAKQISEDDARRHLQEIQQKTDDHTKAIDDLNAAKEKDLMEI